MKAHASEIYLQTTPTALLGQPFNVYVAVSGFPFNVAGFEFDLSFNPEFLSALSVSEGNFLPYSGNTTYFYPGSIDNTNGVVSGVSDITASGTSSASGGTLATVTFEPLLAPFPILQQIPSNIVLSDFQLIDGNGDLLTPDTVNGTVLAGIPGPQFPNDEPPISTAPPGGIVGEPAPSNSPEPATEGLVGGVLFVLGSWWLRKRRKLTV
jgi:hypothetical protein